MADDKEQQITIDIPTPSTVRSTPVPQEQSHLEQFRRGWVNAIALPDNPTDLLFNITASIAIPALVSSLWVSLPLPGFVRTLGLVTVVIAALVLWQLLAIPEVRGMLIFRLALVTLGVILGL